ncbi:MAG TPA: hypothetical protein VM537_02520 [Anaerolineae bacterium]|nr:hypothetical protein [Anaerolineae bacterium]
MAKKKSAGSGHLGYDTRSTKRGRGGQPGNENAIKSGFYSRSFTDEELLEIGKLAVADLTLDEEIGMLRVVILRVLRSKLGPEKTVELVGRATGQLRRLLETRNRLQSAGESESAIESAMARALDEMSEELGVEL